MRSAIRLGRRSSIQLTSVLLSGYRPWGGLGREPVVMLRVLNGGALRGLSAGQGKGPRWRRQIAADLGRHITRRTPRRRDDRHLQLRHSSDTALMRSRATG